MCLIKMDDFVKEVVYGYSGTEKDIIGNITPIRYVSETSQARNEEKRESHCVVSKMQKSPNRNNDFER